MSEAASAAGARRLYVVTGASRGLGAALVARLLASPSNTVLGIARKANDGHASLAAAHGAAYEAWAADLAEPGPVAARLEAWLAAHAADGFAEVVLVNNAAALTTIGALENCKAGEVASALRVGLEAPALLSAAFLRATKTWSGARRVLNISSGLGRRAMAGQASYCAVKAGLDHLTRAMALDQALLPNGAKLVSLAPGVIDTDMQVQLRGAGGEGFPDQPMFQNLKASGALVSAEATAERVLAYLARDDFGATPVADIRDA